VSNIPPTSAWNLVFAVFMMTFGGLQLTQARQAQMKNEDIPATRKYPPVPYAFGYVAGLVFEASGIILVTRWIQLRRKARMKCGNLR
jgi:hypothetical protein